MGDNPVNVLTGEHILTTMDLKDSAFDGMKASRAQVTQPQYSDMIFGSSWRWSVPQLIDMGPRLHLVFNSRHARSWTKVFDGFGNVTSYTPDFFYKESLTIVDANTLLLLDEGNNGMVFYNFTYPDPNFRGKLYQTFNSYLVSPNPSGVSGTYVQASYTAGGVFGGLSQQEQSLGVIDFNNRSTLTANLGGPFANLVCLSIFQFHLVAGASSTVRWTNNEFYDGTDPANGPAGSLKLLTIYDPATNAIERKYYRYGNSGGIVTLRTAVEGAAYERLKAAVGSDAAVLTASDATVSLYANTWQYDGAGRTISETIQGKGTCTFGSPTDSGFAEGTNSWKRKVVETRPDGNQHISYVTFTGQPILKVLKSGATQWATYYMYDAQGRLVYEATPAAVASFSEALPSLVTLHPSAGLVKLTNYGASTTATTATPGDVQGYVKTRQIKIGATGTPITTEAYTYIAHQATMYGQTRTTYAIASKTVYENTDGTGGRTTSYAYTWHVPPGGSASNLILSKTTTHPIVTTAKNGSNAATSNIQFFDKWRHPTYFKDEDGFIQRNQWNRLTGAMTQHIDDVNTTTATDEPAGWVHPAGGGLHRTTAYVDDMLGRWTKITHPDATVTCKVYKDSNWEERTYPGWTGTTTTGPTQISRKDKAGSYDEELTTTVTPAVSGGLPTGAESLAGTTLIHSLKRTKRDAGNRVTNEDSYFTFSGLTYGTGTLGVQGTHTVTAGTHFHRRSLTYEVRGLVEKEIDWTGTIRKNIWDGLGRLSQKWIGTSDANLIKTEEFVYDAGGVGNSRLTTSKFFTAAATSLDTAFAYDTRDRRTDTRGPDKVARKVTYDNLDRTLSEQTYADADSNFVIGATELRGKRETKYDEKGQIYQTVVHEVDCATGAAPGTIRDRLTTNFWSNARGLPLKSRGPNGQFGKTRYDGLGRVTGVFTSFQDAETAYADADDVVGDTVIDQAVSVYDAVGNVIQVTRYQRTDASAKTGDLSASWLETDSRRTYQATWFDAVRRTTSVVDYGRNGGAAFVRPATAPAPNTTNNPLVKYDYNAAGRQYRITDNKARITELTFDLLSRTTKTVENYINGAVAETETDTDRTTETPYDGAGRLWKRIARNPKGTGLGVQLQTTQYVYGTEANLASPAVRRFDVLTAEIHADSDDTYNPVGADGAKLATGVDATYDRVEYTYDYASRKLTWKLPLTTTHTFTYDSAGRPFTDQATALGTGVDGAVRRFEIGYDDLSRRVTVSSYSATSAGTLLNQVRFTYDGWGNEQKWEQGHEGTATGAPSFQRTFAEGVAGEAKYVRMSQLTYPNARAVFINYPADTAAGGKLSRPDNIANDAAGTSKFALYTYLGIGSATRVTLGATGVSLDYGTGTGNPGGWDDWGRIDDQKWAAGATLKDQYQYGYDRTSQRTFRDNLTATTAPNDAKEHFYTYNGLDQLTVAKQGNLNAGRTDITAPAAVQETFTVESHGNWRALVRATAGTTTLNQTRTHTAANEVTTIAASVGTNWGDGAVDRNGFMTRVPKVTSLQNERWQLTSDAWMRVVKVVNDVGGATIAEYKYDALGRRTAKLKPNGVNWDRRDYYYNGEWQVAEERELLNTASKTTAATVPKFQWIWGTRYVDEVVLRDENKNGDGDCTDAGPTDQRIYYCQDANMNVTALLDAAGAVVERTIYDAYGRHVLYNAAWSATQASTLYRNEVLFTGYRLDPESGLYQVRHRHYHSTLGRWVQRDPLGHHDSMNLYEYVVSHPTSGMDPFGLALTYKHSEDRAVQDSIPHSSTGSGRGVTDPSPKANPASWECAGEGNCDLTVPGAVSTHIKLLRVGHPKWEQHHSVYDARWGKNRGNLTEREATLAHERDHAAVFRDFVKNVNTALAENNIERRYRSPNNCKAAGKCAANEINRLYGVAGQYSAKFDQDGWNQGGTYDEHPFTEKPNLKPCKRE
jgi:RHS repeat-associated protein